MEYDIEKSFESVNEYLDSLIQEQRMTNALLTVLCSSKLTSYDIPKNNTAYIGKSFIIANESYSNVFDFVSNIVRRDEKKLHVFEEDKLAELMAMVTNMQNGDYLLLKNNDLIKKPDFIDAIIRAYEDSKVDIQIGKGPAARNITLDLPKINIILWTYYVELLSPKIKRTFIMAKDED